ncbi:MAG TPA: hypothetical protein VHV08_03555 [Pirellulales bacterium]|jgi:hypothetical protein|nr:hypothetical protein [Pirellulales bacterium]
MKDSRLSRRDFERLTAAAVGGLLAGTTASVSAADTPPGKDKNKNPILGEPHICRGINMCKGLGAKKDNACAGQGACATAKAHSCHADNDCRGQGGCGAKPGENSCKAMGECGVPLSTSAWKKARARFEELMKADGKTVGPAPPKKA